MSGACWEVPCSVWAVDLIAKQLGWSCYFQTACSVLAVVLCLWIIDRPAGGDDCRESSWREHERPWWKKICCVRELAFAVQHNTIKDTVAQHGSESDNTALHNTWLKGNHAKNTILSWFIVPNLYDWLSWVKKELSSTMSTLGIVTMVDPLSLNWKCSLDIQSKHFLLCFTQSRFEQHEGK